MNTAIIFDLKFHETFKTEIKKKNNVQLNSKRLQIITVIYIQAFFKEVSISLVFIIKEIYKMRQASFKLPNNY